MSNQRHIRKRASLKPTSTPLNPLKTRGFGKGIQARNAQLPKSNPLQTRPFGTPSQGLSQQQETRSIEEQMEGTAQFGYNAANIQNHAPETSQRPVQRKEGKFGGWNQPPIQRVDPVMNRLNMWREEQASDNKGQETQPNNPLGNLPEQTPIQKKEDELTKAPASPVQREIQRTNTAKIQRMKVQGKQVDLDNLDNLSVEELSNILWRFSFARDTISLDNGEDENDIIKAIKDTINQKHKVYLDEFRDGSKLELKEEDYTHIRDRHYNDDATSYYDTPSQWSSDFTNYGDLEHLKGIGGRILDYGALEETQRTKKYVKLEGYYNFGHITGSGYGQDGSYGHFTGARAYYYVDLEDLDNQKIYLKTVYPKGGFTAI
jgi:hypothetical protein